MSYVPPRRSDGTIHRQRTLQPWPRQQPFRILSIDGGGICGILPAAMLAALTHAHGVMHRAESLSESARAMAQTETTPIVASTDITPIDIPAETISVDAQTAAKTEITSADAPIDAEQPGLCAAEQSDELTGPQARSNGSINSPV